MGNTTKHNETHMKKIIHLNQSDFAPEMQYWLNICKLINVRNHTSGLKGKAYMIISIDKAKASWQNPTCFHNNSPRESRTKGNTPQHS